jgi:protein phosphatase 1G
LLREGAAKGLWPKSFADKHAFNSDPVIAEPDVTRVRFLPEDEFLVMATDGLWDAVPMAEVVAWARKQFNAGAGAQQVADSLTELALKRYTTDNTSVVVVDLRADRTPGRQAAAGGGWLGGLFGGKA